MDTLTENHDPRKAFKRIPGDRLSALMRERGVRQAELADRTDIPQGAISRAARTGLGLSDQKWERLADALGVSLDYFFCPAENNT